MTVSDSVIEKLKAFEGLRLTAYKPVSSEKYWTIGYGHYGADVTEGMKITREEADRLFRNDLERFVCYVNNLHREWNQEQFDALVSFCYNCGPGNLEQLCKNRTPEEIADKMLLYVKDASGRTLPGLVNRRKWERELFLSGVGEEYVVTASNLNIRDGAGVEGTRVIGGYCRGDRIKVLETWHRTCKGWISGDYCVRG